MWQLAAAVARLYYVHFYVTSHTVIVCLRMPSTTCSILRSLSYGFGPWLRALLLSICSLSHSSVNANCVHLRRLNVWARIVPYALHILKWHIYIIGHCCLSVIEWTHWYVKCSWVSRWIRIWMRHKVLRQMSRSAAGVSVRFNKTPVNGTIVEEMIFALTLE